MAGRIAVAGVRFRRCAEGRGDAPSAARLAELVADLEAGRLENRKSGRRKELYAVALAGGGAPDHLLKVNRYAGVEGWLRRLRGSKARLEVARAREVDRRGVPTPLPVAWGERVAGGRLRACLLLVPLLPGVADLEALERDPGVPPRERRALASAFGALARRIHDAGIFQDDFAPNNFLVRRGDPPALWMIDFERARMRHGPVSERERLHMLAKLERRLPGASPGERVRFLTAYAGGDGVELRARWHALAERAPRLARRDLARLRRTAGGEGRRYTRVGARGVTGWARREAPLAALLEGSVPADAVWRSVRPGLSPGRARELWALANLLWMRGLGPQPLACVVRNGASELFLARAPDEVSLAGLGEPGRVRGALAGLVGRLLALGSLARTPAPAEISLRASPGRPGTALLLAPDLALVGAAPPAHARLPLARRLVRELLEGPARS